MELQVLCLQSQASGVSAKAMHLPQYVATRMFVVSLCFLTKLHIGNDFKQTSTTYFALVLCLIQAEFDENLHKKSVNSSSITCADDRMSRNVRSTASNIVISYEEVLLHQQSRELLLEVLVTELHLFKSCIPASPY